MKGVRDEETERLRELKMGKWENGRVGERVMNQKWMEDWNVGVMEDWKLVIGNFEITPF